MTWPAALAIYFLFWFGSLFFVLPFGVRTHADLGTRAEAGHAESAPVHFDGWRIARRTTIVSLILFGLYYLNYVNGWITVDMIDLTRFKG